VAWRVRRRRAVLWRGASLGFLIVVAAFVAPGAADAHIRSGVIAVDYRVTVYRLLPPFATAIKVQVSESDRALSLTAGRGHLVVVLGYSGEAFLRLDSAGVAVNMASATAVSTGLVERPGRAPGGRAAWRTQSDGPTTRSGAPTAVVYRQGVLSNLGNPKMAVFFTSLLPQFAGNGGSGSFFPFLFLGVVFCLLTLGWLSMYALVVAKAADFLRRRSIRRLLAATTGAVLVGVGIRLAVEER
jgi:LysE type translocator